MYTLIRPNEDGSLLVVTGLTTDKLRAEMQLWTIGGYVVDAITRLEPGKHLAVSMHGETPTLIMLPHAGLAWADWFIIREK